MIHYTDHFLDLFVRNSPALKSLRADINEHLADCFYCRERARDLFGFYCTSEASQNISVEHSDLYETTIMES